MEGKKQTNKPPKHHFDIINILKYLVYVQNKTKLKKCLCVHLFVGCIAEKHFTVKEQI